MQKHNDTKFDTEDIKNSNKEAESYFQKAFEMKNGCSAYQLAKLYLFNKDLELEFKYYSEAMELGYDDAYMYVYKLEKDNDKKIDVLENGAIKNIPDCCETLGDVYKYGLHGRQIDYKKAFYYYNKSCDLKNYVFHKIADIYKDGGNGVD